MQQGCHRVIISNQSLTVIRFIFFTWRYVNGLGLLTWQHFCAWKFFPTREIFSCLRWECSVKIVSQQIFSRQSCIRRQHMFILYRDYIVLQICGVQSTCTRHHMRSEHNVCIWHPLLNCYIKLLIFYSSPFHARERNYSRKIYENT